MGRLVVLVVIVVIAVWLVRRALRAPAARAHRPLRDGELVACAHCGLHLPRAEALEVRGGLYCSEEHARRGGA